MQLYNKLSSDERSRILDLSNQKRITLSFYQYAKINNPKGIRDELFIFWDSIDVLGRIYIANEGINAQLSLPEVNLKMFIEHLNSISFLKKVRINIALKHEIKSFLKLKIKVRDKIVADGLNDDSFDVTKKGIQDKLKDHKDDKNLLMYCTGGIRCEKASAYFKHKGFKNVYQLEGGIIEYVRQVEDKQLENNFIGKNFVFDNRRVEKVSDEIIAKCHQCGEPFDIHTNCANDACHLLFIQCDDCKTKMKNCCSYDCLEISQMPYEVQKKMRKGQKNSNDIFKKGRTDKITTFKK